MKRSGRRSSLEPDLNFIAIRIGDVSVGKAGSELTTTEQPPSGAFDLGDGTVDVLGVHEPKAEMCDAPAETGGGGGLGEGGDVVPSRNPEVGQGTPPPLLPPTQHLFPQPPRPSPIPD